MPATFCSAAFYLFSNAYICMRVYGLERATTLACCTRTTQPLPPLTSAPILLRQTNLKTHNIVNFMSNYDVSFIGQAALQQQQQPEVGRIIRNNNALKTRL